MYIFIISFQPQQKLTFSYLFYFKYYLVTNPIILTDIVLFTPIFITKFRLITY